MGEQALSTQEMTEYLKKVSALETSIYNQSQVINDTQSVFVRNKPQQENVTLLEYVQVPNRPLPPAKQEEEGLNVYLVLSFLGIIILPFAMKWYVSEEKNIVFAVILGLFGLVPSVFFPIFCLIDHCKREHEYKDQCAQYSQTIQQIDAIRADACNRNKAIESENNNRIAQANERYSQRCAAYNSNLNFVQGQLFPPLEQAQNALAALYSEDVIFPKYRNLVAMCSIYEYFASGRVTELTGPNGAYNLYESELRQNIIISELQRISSNLEKIKNNQYILYMGLKEGSESLHRIHDEVQSIAQSSYEIADSAEIAAYCSQMSKEIAVIVM